MDDLLPARHDVLAEVAVETSLHVVADLNWRSVVRVEAPDFVAHLATWILEGLARILEVTVVDGGGGEAAKSTEYERRAPDGLGVELLEVACILAPSPLEPLAEGADEHAVPEEFRLLPR